MNIEYVKAKPQGSKSMSGILNALEQKDLFSIFNQLLQKNKAFAFNILDCIRPQYTLFKTLFDQLNIQQKEDYKAYLKTKSTIKAKYILGKFYLNNKESSSNLSTENSNKPLVQNKDDLPAAHFSPIPYAFEETVVEHTFDTRLELSSDKEDQLCSQIVPPFEGFAEFHNQFRNIVLENSTTIVFSKINDKVPLWYYQPKVVNLYIYTLAVVLKVNRKILKINFYLVDYKAKDAFNTFYVI